MRAYNQLTKEQIDTVQKGYFTAKQEGYAGVEPFLQEEMNADKKVCYFFETHAFASAFFPNKETAEITAFFLPHRMNRYEYEDFLKEVIRWLRLQGRKNIYIVGNAFCKKEKAILDDIFQKPEYAEYFMKKKGAFVPGSFKEKRMYELEQDGKKIGRCKLESLLSGWYLHGFLIQEEYRNQGHGTKFLQKILQSLTVQKENNICSGFTDVFLQVSSRNIPAVTLYEHAGFEISEQRNFYSYKTMVKRKGISALLQNK